MSSVPGRTSCRIYRRRYNATSKPTSKFFNARTLSSIVGHAVLATRAATNGCVLVLSSDSCLSTTYSTGSGWTCKTLWFAVTREIISCGHCINYRTQNVHALPLSTCCSVALSRSQEQACLNDGSKKGMT